MTIIGTVAWIILIAITVAFFRGRPMKSVREIQDEIAVQIKNVDHGNKLLEVALNDVAFSVAMGTVYDAACEIQQLHEELYQHLDLLEKEAEEREPDESYDPEPGYRIGQ